MFLLPELFTDALGVIVPHNRARTIAIIFVHKTLDVFVDLNNLHDLSPILPFSVHLRAAVRAIFSPRPQQRLDVFFHRQVVICTTAQ